MVSVEDAPTVQEHCPVQEEKQCDGHDGEEAPVEPIGWWLHVVPLDVRIETWVDTPPRNDLFLALKVYGIGDLNGGGRQRNRRS